MARCYDDWNITKTNDRNYHSDVILQNEHVLDFQRTYKEPSGAG